MNPTDIIKQKRAEYKEQEKTTALWSYVSGKIRACDELLAEIKPCVWTFTDSGLWKTACGKLSEHITEFCPHCGNGIGESK